VKKKQQNNFPKGIQHYKSEINKTVGILLI
jgi:hypothetical protein